MIRINNIGSKLFNAFSKADLGGSVLMRMRFALLTIFCFQACVASISFGQYVHQQNPINYREAKANNAITRLQGKIDDGTVVLKHDERTGYLPALLKALKVPVSSQMLVFSKTSLQVEHISPRRPRAIYFGDDVYVGWVQKSGMMEMSAVDPQLGAVFYTLNHEKTEKPQLKRNRGSCLACHATRHTGYVPGHVVFSVYSDAFGSPIAKAGFSSTDHTSRFKDRWGGWYVSGKHGQMRHRGNSMMRYSDRAESFNYEKGANRTNLGDLVNVDPYLSKHSDLVALMVLEHQTMVHNRITSANYYGRIYETQVDTAAKLRAQPKKGRDGKLQVKIDPLARPRLDQAVRRLVDSLLMVRAEGLTQPISGTSNFAKEFAGKTLPSKLLDSKGRSLRELDLKSRLFRYPCSYLIYSEAFDALPKRVRLLVYQELWQVLTGTEEGFRNRHLSEEDRKAVIEILRVTKPELAKAWARQ